MNLSHAYDHDHVYLGPGTLQTINNPTQGSPSKIIRNVVVKQEITGSYSDATFQQTSNKMQYQGVIQHSGNSTIAVQSYSNQSVTTSHPVGNSLDLVGLIREDTPEPEIPVQVKMEPIVKVEEPEEEAEEAPDIDIQIRNVVCNYTLPLHIDLRRFALNSANVTYDRGRGVLLKQKREPNCYVKIYSSGKVYIVGCKSEGECMRAARSVGRNIQRAMGKLRDVVKIRNYKVCNVLATTKMPFGIKIEELDKKYPAQSTYEPELSVGLVWRMQDPKATLRIHTTGSITVTGASSENDVLTAIDIIYPIVKEFRCSERHRPEKKPRKRRAKNAAGPSAKKPSSGAVGNKIYFSDEDDLYDDDDLDELDD